MDIRYKLIANERVEDAPFVAALISAIGCKIGCKGCFNQHIKTMPTLIDDVDTLLDKVQANPFHEGIILGGLEWSEQPDELIALTQSATARKLKVMIYTGVTLESFKQRVPAIDTLKGDIYIKYGAYVDAEYDMPHKMYGVTLASHNQKIVKIGA